MVFKGSGNSTRKWKLRMACIEIADELFIFAMKQKEANLAHVNIMYKFLAFKKYKYKLELEKHKTFREEQKLARREDIKKGSERFKR